MQSPPPGNREVNNDLVPSHQKYIKQETDEITQYIKLHNLDMLTTGTGIYYMFTKHGSGPLAKVGDYVQIAYTISLLDGTQCYDSQRDGARGFEVGKDALETGIHQAVELMHVGDRGTFIIPSYLAQGLVGDKDKIPPGAVVIYDIELLSIKR